MEWSYIYSSDVWPALITLSLVIYLGAYSWQRRDIPAARPFTLVCVLGVCWTTGVILEILAVDYPAKVFWVQFQAIWHLPAVTAITCFILQYADLGRFLTLRNYVLLSLVPLAGAVVMVTNDFHHLMWTGFRMNGQIVMSPGRLYWAFFGYGYAISLVNVVILLRLAIFSPGHRLPVIIMLGSQIVARIAYAIDKLHPDRIGSGEKVLLVVGLMAAAYALAFLRFHVIDPVGAARRAVLEQMREGVFVANNQGSIVYANPMAAAISHTPEHLLREKRLSDLFPVDTGLYDPAEYQGVCQTEASLGKGDSERRFNLLLAPLRGDRNEPIGKLLLARDITTQWRTRNQLIEQQRTMAKLKEREHLARELHDGIGQILGYVSLQAQTALTWMRQGNPEKAGSVMGRIAEVAKDAHADIRDSIRMLRTGLETRKPFIPDLQSFVRRFQDNFGMVARIRVSPDIDENTIDPAVANQLMRVIQEAMTNARKHSGARMLQIGVEKKENSVRITLADDGKGFDTAQPGRSDGSHFGLVFMRERMAQIGGTVTISSRPHSGTVVQLDVPLRGIEE